MSASKSSFPASPRNIILIASCILKRAGCSGRYFSRETYQRLVARQEIALIESMNQEWADLSLDWLSESESGAVKREILRLRGTSAQNDIQGKHRG
jgi:hypothetical protein